MVVFLLGGMCSAHLDAARSNGEGPELVLGVQDALERAVVMMVAEFAAEATAYALLVLLGAGRGEEEQGVGATPLALWRAALS
mmetsp:Transcript_44122/g.76194  ORF Transcript_44122/g.76194 Transcript_44122/m.76194 type:complete len:83 (+) Transcript_44122:297-545(+)